MSFPRTWPHPRTNRRDAALVLAVGAATILGTALLKGSGTADPVAYLLLAATCLPLLVRREAPLVALSGTVVLSCAYDLLDFPGGFYTLSIGIALFTVVDAGLNWRAIAGSASAVGGFIVVGLAAGRGHLGDPSNALWFGGWLAASLVLGEISRSRRAHLREVEERALAAERSREEEARRRAGEERIRIARELHDILGHRISLINVQAGAALHLFDRDPEQARTALVAIKAASHEALGEVRETLGILRQVDEPEPFAPSPGLAQIDAVIAETSAAGLDVRLDVSGNARSLPSGVDLAAYRIIQESLTNVVRHARATSARIAIVYRPTEIEIEVVDDGSQRATAGGTGRTGAGLNGGGVGSGLIGMRERARALGGELEASRSTDGGFRVRATLPTGGVA